LTSRISRLLPKDEIALKLALFALFFLFVLNNFSMIVFLLSLNIKALVQ